MLRPEKRSRGGEMPGMAAAGVQWQRRGDGKQGLGEHKALRMKG